MNSALYQKILKENVRPSVCDLKLKRTWVMQQDNDPKHTSKFTSEWLKKNKIKGIVHPKMKMWCSSAYPQGIQDVGDFVSSVEHKQRFLTQTVAVCH